MIVAQHTTKSNSIATVRQIVLVDSETIRKPFDAEEGYRHAQDQKIKGLCTKIDCAKSLLSTDLYAFIDYSSLVKSANFDLIQAKRGGGFLLQMFNRLKTVFFADNFLEFTESKELILYVKNSSENLEATHSKYEANRLVNNYEPSSQSTNTIGIAKENTAGQQVINFFRDRNADFSNSFKIVSNKSKYEQFASNNSLIFEYGDSWLEKVLEPDYG